MTRRIIVPLLAGAALLTTWCEKDVLSASPTEAMAQKAPESDEAIRAPRWWGMRMDPLGRLLEQREALGLTADQVTRLETLAAQMKERNEALRAQIEARMPERPGLTDEQRERLRVRRGGEGGERPALTPEQREAMRARREEMRAAREELRPLRQELAASQRAAMEGVREILTDDQEAKLRALRPERPARERWMRGPGGDGAGGAPLGAGASGEGRRIRGPRR